jgi:hypothetical protein
LILPNYTFLNKDTNEEITLSLKISEYEDFKKANPHMQQLLSATPLADPMRVAGRFKPESGFRDLLKEVHKKHHGSMINTF